MSNLNPAIITFALYLLVVIGVGFWAYFSTKNFDDYILGGRSLGSLVTALSAGASDMSGWLLMGLPGAVFAAGLTEAWIAVGLTIGAYFNWLWVSGRLRVHTEFNNDALTLPEYFFHRFGAQNLALKIVPAIVILIFFTVYCASGIVAGARLFESLFHIPYHEAMFWGAFATILYTFIGGFLAVSWTDTIQAGLMIFALLITPLMVLLALGDWSNLQMQIAQATQRSGVEYGDWFAGASWVGVVSALAWGLGYFGQPHILARFMASDSVRTLRNARRIGMAWMILCLLGAVSVGYFGMAYFNANPTLAANVTANKERIFIELAQILFNPWIAGVILSAILAAVMSTLSCQLLVCSSALTEDFYKGFVRPQASQKELVWTGRVMVLIVAAVAMLLASNADSQVLKLVSYAWAGFGAAFGPVVILSLLWRRMNAAGALAGMIAGAATVIVWTQLRQAGAGSVFDLYEIVPGFIAATLAIVIVSRTTAANALAEEKFQQANAKYIREATA